MRLITFGGLCGTLLFAGIGCGGSSITAFPVTGTVTIEGEGALNTGEIIFTTDRIRARGPIKPDGTFKLMTTAGEKEVEGAPAGKYRAYIIGAAWYEEGTEFNRASKLLIDPKYSDYNTSGLEFQVDEKPNDFKIVVTKPKK